jgi:hypothetical protein
MLILNIDLTTAPLLTAQIAMLGLNQLIHDDLACDGQSMQSRVI